MRAFLRFDQSFGGLFTIQVIGEADPSHDGYLCNSWDFTGCASLSAQTAGYENGKIISKNTIIQV